MLQKGTVEKKTFELLDQLMQESVLASTIFYLIDIMGS